MNENKDPKKPFIDAFRKQKEELEGCLAFWKKLEEDASESDKREMAQNSPLLERIDDLVNGEPEMPSATIETALNTMDEYLKAMDKFSEDQFEAFIMGVGVNWLNLPYWGIQSLNFQCKKIEESMTSFKDRESKNPAIYEKLNPVNALPVYIHSKKLLQSEILANELSLYKSIMQVLSDRTL
jgi:hypothetical protein